MFKLGKVYFLLLFFTFSFKGFVYAQDNYSAFEKYNNRRLGPFTTYFHEAHIVSAVGIDINYRDKVLGNFFPGANYGLGLGYLFKIKLDNSIQSIGLGLNAEYFPSRFYKFNIGAELLGIGFGNDRWFACLFTGAELNLIYRNDLEEKEMAWTLYMAHFGFQNLDIKWGLQSYYDALLPNMDIDDTFLVFKCIYKFKF
jgi:hypothetical protein